MFSLWLKKEKRDIVNQPEASPWGPVLCEHLCWRTKQGVTDSWRQQGADVELILNVQTTLRLKVLKDVNTFWHKGERARFFSLIELVFVFFSIFLIAYIFFSFILFLFFLFLFFILLLFFIFLLFILFLFFTFSTCLYGSYFLYLLLFIFSSIYIIPIYCISYCLYWCYFKIYFLLSILLVHLFIIHYCLYFLLFILFLFLFIFPIVYMSHLFTPSYFF